MRRTPFLAALAVTVASGAVVACAGSDPAQPPVDVATVRAGDTRSSSPVPTDLDSVPVDEIDPAPAPPRDMAVDPGDLRRAAAVAVFFGHQSVGGNVLKGVVAIFEEAGLPPPLLIDIDGDRPAPASGGYLAHGPVGRNGDPLAKIRHFDELLRRDSAADIEVALLKLCYADVKERTDTQALFTEYREALGLLESRLPDVVFLHTTVPLTVDDPEDNVARSAYNSQMREVYGASGRLWDLALVESTTPDGHRVHGVWAGHEYEALHPGYTTDGGHLNDEGAQRAAAALLRLLAHHGRR